MTNTTIELSTNDEALYRPKNSDMLGKAEVIPGELLSVDAGELQPHAVADGVGYPIFAVERDFVEPAANVKNIDHPYAIGETPEYSWFQSGDIVWAWGQAGLVAEKGETLLTSDGAGGLKAAPAVDDTLISTSVIAIAWQTLTVGGGGRERLQVRIK